MLWSAGNDARSLSSLFPRAILCYPLIGCMHFCDKKRAVLCGQAACADAAAGGFPAAEEARELL